MTATYNGNSTLSYDNCRKELDFTDDAGAGITEALFENGHGFFSVCDGVLLWDGTADESRRRCVFEKCLLRNNDLI